MPRSVPRSFSPSGRRVARRAAPRRREEENCRREAAANKISSLKNPGALSRGHLINNDVEEPARRCSLRREGRGAQERRRAARAKATGDKDG